MTKLATQKKGIFGKSTSDNDGMGDVDQAFLSQIEENIRSKGNEQVDAKKEAEQRAKEMERIRNASANLPTGATAAQATGGPSQSGTPKKSNPLENDPRYKEYFERLRRQKGEQPSSATVTPARGVASAPATGQATSGAASQKVGPGSIVRFDDGSIGVYKDAVSGKDYALFYFLSPDGQFQPEGVFLQCYQAKVIGLLPEDYFAVLRDDGSWNRDVVVFHLAKFEFVEDLNNLSEHEERKPSKTPLRNASVQPHHQQQSQAQPTPPPQEPKAQQPQAVQSQPTPAPQEKSTGQNAEASSEPTLVKGRRFQIKFSGKQWEAVYWSSEGENSIVAHDTHGTWSLMRLDLSRFKDSLELLEIVDDETMEAIAKQAATEG